MGDTKRFYIEERQHGVELIAEGYRAPGSATWEDRWSVAIPDGTKTRYIVRRERDRTIARAIYRAMVLHFAPIEGERS